MGDVGDEVVLVQEEVGEGGGYEVLDDGSQCGLFAGAVGGGEVGYAVGGEEEFELR